MNRRLLWISSGASAAVLCAVTLALAAGGGTGDRTTAEALIQQLSADQPHKAIVAEPLQHAKDALERGTRMRAAGDEAHARLADGLAREWAETARDLVRAADAENAAAAARQDAVDAGAQLDRERAMLEESITRAGRLRAELANAEREAKETNRTAAIDAGAPPKGPATTPAPRRQGGPR